MKILVIEDDKYISELLSDELGAASHIVEIQEDGTSGSYNARVNTYDVIILDYSLPGKNGIDVCKEIRAAGKTTPIIFVSATEDMQTKVEALDAGADDYMVKPFALRELMARLKALSRRPHTIQTAVIHAGGLIIDCNTQTVTKGRKKIRLSRKEFALIEFLAKHKGKSMSRAHIMDHVWSAEIDPFSNTVEAHIRLLRKKIGKRNGAEIIQNISGRGYSISP